MEKSFFIFLLAAGFFLSLFLLNCFSPQQSYDLVIKNAQIIDGSGKAGFTGDVGIKDSRIIKLGDVATNNAKKIIDAKGLTLTPGFIDVHTHCDRGIAKIPTVDNYIHQGVTTVIGGNCGGHPFPLKELFSKLGKEGISLNFGCLIGHNTIRRKVMEYKMEDPTPEELEEMKTLIDGEMREGALGFSTGLAYLPGIYSTTEELVNLASAIAPYKGIYASHIRDQGDHITEAIKEAIEVGERNGIPVEISHIKLAKDSVWEEHEMITGPVEKAQKRGVNVHLDQYPYTATSSGFTSSFPSWAFEGGKEEFLKRLKDRKTYNRIKNYIIERRLTSTKGIDKLETIYIASYRKNPDYQGKNLKEILISRGQKPTIQNGVNLIIEIEKNGGASGVFFQMDEKDVQYLMKLSYTMHASDGAVRVFGEGIPHPRNYGTFPRVISHYVREKGVLKLEEAIRKMTSLPAQVFSLKDRGLIKEGMFADITIFDYENIKDKATFSNPHQYGEGFSYIIINGKIVIENDKYTGALPGMVLYGPGKNN